MDATTLKIALAGLMHDLGKFADRDVLEMDRGYEEQNQALYCPSYQGRYSHGHALQTAFFIEQAQPWLPPQLFQEHWGDGGLFLNLAAMHHKPENLWQAVITQADRLSSGLDRDKIADGSPEIPFADFRKTRLQPLFEQLSLSGPAKAAGAATWCYPLRPVDHESIFPGPRQTLEPADRNRAKAEYADLFRNFLEALKLLQHREESLELWLEHFDSLLLLHTANIPSARAGDVVPDVSLYDHAHSTAALAAALYLYHRDTETLTETAIKDQQPDKFLLISGDFYGIQDFIFSTHGDTRRFRSKLLRGRSFAVSLFSELAADLLCREIGLPVTSLVLNAGGKFTILAPNTPAAVDAVARVDRQVNDWLINLSFGQNSLGLSTLTASPRDFHRELFQKFWQRVRQGAADRKFSRLDLERHGGVCPGFLNSFDNSLKPPLCPFCGCRPSQAEVRKSSYLAGPGQDPVDACPVCRDHIFLGANLVGKSRLAVVDQAICPDLSDRGLFQPIFGRYQLLFSAVNLKQGALPNSLLRCWDLSGHLDRSHPSGLAAKYVNGYIPRFQPGQDQDPRFAHLGEPAPAGDPKTFGHLAALALNPSDSSGLEALGVLKADVDNLGKLMAEGLAPERLTIARQATLSRQLDFFFTVFLPHLLRTETRFSNVYTLFAGGDDLFLIGPWNAMIDLVAALQDRFADYVCRNPDLHFSAGLVVHKPGTPVDAMARTAEQALEASKEGPKNQLTLFGETIALSQYGRLMEIRQELNSWMEQKYVHRAMLYRLNEILSMAAEEKRLVQEGQTAIKVEDMNCTRWRSLLAYSTERNVGREMGAEFRSGFAREVREKIATWIEQYGGALKMPLWDILYNSRR